MTSYNLYPLLPYKANCLVNPFLRFLFFHSRNSLYYCNLNLTHYLIIEYFFF